MALIKLNSDKAFDALKGKSILESAEAAGVQLPYSCRDGRCKSCKCKIIGKTSLLSDELGLSEQEKKDGFKLACVREVLEDVDLEITDLEDFEIPRQKTLPCKISSIDRLSDTILLRLRFPPGQQLKFLMGQYIDLIGPGGIHRSYSIAGSYPDGSIELHIKRYAGGRMSTYLFEQAEIGDLLRVNGPKGTFFLRKFEGKDVVFLATGTGLAPVKAILNSLPKNIHEIGIRSISLYWGVRKPADFYTELGPIPDELRYFPVISQNTTNWSGHVGYVQDILLKQVDSFENVQVYACGSSNMINDAQRLLTQRNLGFDDFMADAFTVSG